MGFVIPGQLASKSLSVEGERPLLTLSGDANRDNLTGLQLSKQDTLGQRILDFPLNRATQRARAEDRIKAHVGQQLASRISCASIRLASFAIIRSTMRAISGFVSGGNTIVSSTRLRNSGRKCCLSSSATFAFMRP